MAGMCCTGTECGDLVPVQDIGELLQEETTKYRERILKMETDLKSNTVKVRTVHKINLGLIEELSLLRRVCVAVDAERRDAQLKLDLEGQIVKQLVRQLRQAKAEKPRGSPVTSTPDGTRGLLDDSEISIIPPEPQIHIDLSDDEVDEALRKLGESNHQGHNADNIHEQITLRLDTSDHSQSPRVENISKEQSDKKYDPTPSPRKSGKHYCLRKRGTDPALEHSQQSSRKRSISQETDETHLTSQPERKQKRTIRDIKKSSIILSKQGLSDTKYSLPEANQRSMSKNTLKRHKCAENLSELIQFPKKSPSILEETSGSRQENKTQNAGRSQSTNDEKKNLIRGNNRTQKRVNKDNSKLKTPVQSQTSKMTLSLPETSENLISEDACTKPKCFENCMQFRYSRKKGLNLSEVISHYNKKNENQDGVLSQSTDNETKKFTDIQNITVNENKNISATEPEQRQTRAIDISIPKTVSISMDKDACKRPECLSKCMQFRHISKEGLSKCEEISHTKQQQQSQDAALSQTIIEGNETKYFTSEDKHKSDISICSTVLKQSQASEIETSVLGPSHGLINKDACTIPACHQTGNNEKKISKSSNSNGTCDDTNTMIDLVSTSEKSAIPERGHSWLTTPEIIKDSLDVLRRSFISESEDHLSIWYKGGQTANKAFPDKSKCEFCNPEVECVEDEERCHDKDSASFVDFNLCDALKIKVPNNKYVSKFCNLDVCKEDDEGCHSKGRDALQNKYKSVFCNVKVREEDDEGSYRKEKDKKSAEAEHSVILTTSKISDTLKKQIPKNKYESEFCNLEVCEEEGEGCRNKGRVVNNSKSTEPPVTITYSNNSDVKINVLTKKAKCDICNPEKECEEDHDGCHDKGRDENRKENASSLLNFNLGEIIKKVVGTKSDNDKYELCNSEGECQEDEEGCHNKSTDKNGGEKYSSLINFKFGDILKKVVGNKNDKCELCKYEVKCEVDKNEYQDKDNDVNNANKKEHSSSLTDSNVTGLKIEGQQNKYKFEFCNLEQCVCEEDSKKTEQTTNLTDSNSRKAVNTKVPLCKYCNPEVKCEENENGCHDKDGDEKDSKKTDQSITSDKPFSNFNTQEPNSVKKVLMNPSHILKKDNNSRVSYEKTPGLNEKTSPENGRKDKCKECGVCRLKEGDEVDICCEARIQEIENLDRVESERPRILSLESKAAPKKVEIIEEEPAEDSGGSSCGGGCESYYREKLLATLQILENKEETIRIQGSSLGVAEGRIAELTKRAGALKAELDHKAQELSKLRQLVDSYGLDKSDGCVTADMQEVETQKHVVASLEDNLSMIAELYRECFYEAAKQEELIDLLRKSYLDVRLMERNKSENITRLQNVINTQKRSIEQCQDVVIEVESLKSEISSFLNSSNNDSGMWERGSECGDVGEELADILDQLRQLQDMLTSGCTCALSEENRSIKEKNNALQIELDHVRQRNSELDAALRKLLDQQKGRQCKDKERELQEAHKKLADVEKVCKEREQSCETLTRQLQQAQVMLNDKSAELTEVQRTQLEQEATIKRLQQDLCQAEQQIKEDLQKLSDISSALAHHQKQSQATVSGLEQQLRRVLMRCQDLEITCRDKEESLSEMQSSLEQAHARGVLLCEESRRVTACVRQWMRRKRQQTREQEKKIRRQELLLHELQHAVGERQHSNELTSQSEIDPCCSNTIIRERLTSASEMSHPRCSRIDKATCQSDQGARPRCGRSLPRCMREDEIASRSKCTQERESGSEMASCSQAPIPPRRHKRQKSCDEQVCPWSGPRTSPDSRWVQLRHLPLRQYSPTDEVLSRVEHLNCALEDSQRRWGRHRR